MTDRFLVMGDNHGDTESLRRVREDIRGEAIDLAIHVGDFTSAWRRAKSQDDEKAGKALGRAQLREVEPVLADIEAETNHGLLLVWGNQDYFGDLDESLHVGTEIPPAGHLIVGEHRFTNDPTAVTPGDILITHMEKWSLIDHFDGRAHFCGNTHRGRYKDRRLNAAFLQVTEPETGRQRFGGTSSWRSGTSRVSTWRCGLSATSSGWSVTPTGSGVCSSNPPLAAVCTVGISAS